MDKIYHIGKGKGKETLFLSGRCFTSASVPAKQIRITEKNLNWLKTHVHRHDSPEFFLVVSGRFNFMLDGKPWYPVGVNYWTSNYAALEWRRYMQGFEEHPELMKELGEKSGAYVASLSGATQKVLASVF